MPTVADAFEQPLPSITFAWDAATENRPASSQTDSTRPPAWWNEVAASNYVDLADAYLQSVRASLQHQSASDPDPLARLRSEADVVTFGNQHLLYHVDAALGVRHGANLEKVAEYSVDERHRVDVAWRLAHKTEAFALFEYKRARSIIPAEFEAAKWKTTDGDISQLAAMERKKKAADDKPGNVQEQTFFTGRSISLMQQIASYSQNERLNCNYLCLFDSNHLFLGIFGSDPYYLQGTLLPAQGHGQASLVRKTLLGFLLDALDAKTMRRTNHKAIYHDIYQLRSGGKTVASSTPKVDGGSLAKGKTPTGAAGGVVGNTGSAPSTPKGTVNAAAKAATSSTPKGQATAASTVRIGSSGALPVRTSPAKKPKVDPKTKKPVVDKDGKVVYE